jgi:hypothetical protein
MPERIARLLGETLVQAIDAFFDAWRRENAALLANDPAAAQAAIDDCRAALGTWLALLVERLDSRNAQVLVELHKRVESLESLMRVGDHGHDDTGRP